MGLGLGPPGSEPGERQVERRPTHLGADPRTLPGAVQPRRRLHGAPNGEVVGPDRLDPDELTLVPDRQIE